MPRPHVAHPSRPVKSPPWARAYKRLAALSLLMGALFFPGRPSRAQPASRPLPVLPLEVTVAESEEDNANVIDDAWLDAQVAQANALFQPVGVQFRLVARHTMPTVHARLETRRDRHALGARIHVRRIDWFVVASLRDVDEPDRFRQGVHWRPRGAAYPRDAHFVITSAIAGPTVLAHELGHYFGNGHSDTPGNLMSYDRGDVPPFFDAAQGRRVRASVRRFLDAGQLEGAR